MSPSDPETEGRSPGIEGFVRGYYYLAPLWFVLESFFWPGLRAVPLAGHSAAGRVVFYLIEAGLGFAFWRKLPWAGAGALAENVIYLIAAARYVIFTPLDIAMDIDTAPAAGMAQEYARTLPGILFAMAQVTFTLKMKLWRWDRSR